MRLAQGLACAALLYAAAERSIAAQDEHEDASSRELTTHSGDEAVEAYLGGLGLKEVLAEQLAGRVATLSARERVPVAEKLAALYVDLLSEADTGDSRRLWEAKAKKLLDDVPEADTFELRLSLARAVYQRAEEIAERYRLRLASEEEAAEAEGALRGVITTLTDVAGKVHGRVETYERAEEQGRDMDSVVRDGQTLQELLSESRRLRSLANYYAGWSYYYVDYLRSAISGRPVESNGASGGGREALRCFGWLLGAPDGREATLDRVSKGLFKYEHIARSAIACGLVYAQRGNDSEAMKWLELVANAEETPESVRRQMLPRLIGVLAAAGRWADVDSVVNSARRDETGNTAPLDVPAARLLVIVSLEANAGTAEASNRRSSELAKIGLGDLVLRGEVSHVIDLASRYGTAALGDSGFIVRYVRAIKAYEDAQSLREQRGAGDSDAEPTRDPEVAEAYRTASSLFAQSVDEADAAQFPQERARARLLAGLTRMTSGDLLDAAELLLAASRVEVGAGDAEKKSAEESLWGAVVAFDRAVSDGIGGDEAKEKRAQAVALYLRLYPASQRSATLLLRDRGGNGAVASGRDDEQTLGILLAVEPGSAVYEASRREAARILYARFRASRGAAGGDRDFAAMRFVGIAEDLLNAEKTTALGKASEEATAAAERAIVRARQMLDALLSVSSPDAARAERVLQSLRGVAAYHGMTLDDSREELLFREMQIALVKNETERAEALLGQLVGAASSGGAPTPGKGEAGQFVIAAHRLMYMRAVDAWKQAATAGAAGAAPSEESLVLARVVIERGTKVIAGFGGGDGEDGGAGGAAIRRDAGMLSVYANVAQAAVEVWKKSQENEARDLAIRMDTAILAASPNVEPSLARLAETSEAAGDAARALECWRLLMAGRTQNTDAWYEARYHSLRLLAKIDPARARQAMDQFIALNPEYGPAEWRLRMRDLDASLPPAPAKNEGTGKTGGAS